MLLRGALAALILCGTAPATVGPHSRFSRPTAGPGSPLVRAHAPIEWREGAARMEAGPVRAKLDRGSIALTLPARVDGACPQMAYRLTSVRAGTDTLYDGRDAAPAEPEDGRAVFRHARVVEIYEPRAGGIEQSFRLDAPPLDAGDLEIRGTLTTNLIAPADGTTGDRLALRRGGRDIFAITDAVALDARGRRLPLALACERGDIVIRVPAAWMAGAAYPMIVDPLLGSAITIDAGIVESYLRPADLAYGAGGYLLVWNEFFGPGGDGATGTDDDDYDLYAQALGADGALVGPTLPLDLSVDAAGECAVAWRASTSEYLVVYREFIAGDAALDQIKGVVVGATAGAGFIVNDDQTAPDRDAHPDVASTGGIWRVVWSKQDDVPVPAAVSSVWGRDVTAAGTFASSSYLVADTPAMESRPAVAFSGGACLIGWDTATDGTSGEAFACTASAASPPAIGAAAAVSTVDASPSGVIRIAGGASGFLCVWQDIVGGTGLGGDGEIRGLAVSAAGVPGGTPFTVPPTAGYDALPDVAYSPGAAAYVISWTSATIVAGEIALGDAFASVYDAATLAPLETVTLAGTPALEFAIAVAPSMAAPEACAIMGLYTGTDFTLLAQRLSVPAGSGAGGGGGGGGGGAGGGGGGGIPGAGPGGRGRDNPNGNQWINDGLCSAGVAANALGLVWVAALLAIAGVRGR